MPDKPQSLLTVVLAADELLLPELQAFLDDWASLVSHVDREIGAGQRLAKWRVAGLRRSSPAVLDLEPRAIHTKDTRRVQKIPSAIYRGMQQLDRSATVPRHFNRAALDAARRLATHARLGEIRVSLSDGGPGGGIRVTERVIANVKEILEPRSKDMGEVEGILEGVSIHNRDSLFVYDVLTRERVECIADRAQILAYVAYLGQRVLVEGGVAYDRDGKPVRITIERLTPFPSPDKIPALSDLIGMDPQYPVIDSTEDD